MRAAKPCMQFMLHSDVANSIAAESKVSLSCPAAHEGAGVGHRSLTLLCSYPYCSLLHAGSL